MVRRRENKGGSLRHPSLCVALTILSAPWTSRVLVAIAPRMDSIWGVRSTASYEPCRGGERGRNERYRDNSGHGQNAGPIFWASDFVRHLLWDGLLDGPEFSEDRARIAALAVWRKAVGGEPNRTRARDHGEAARARTITRSDHLR